jgi:hypothetical protein
MHAMHQEGREHCRWSVGKQRTDRTAVVKGILYISTLHVKVLCEVERRDPVWSRLRSNVTLMAARGLLDHNRAAETGL